MVRSVEPPTVLGSVPRAGVTHLSPLPRAAALVRSSRDTVAVCDSLELPRKWLPLAPEPDALGQSRSLARPSLR